MIKGLAITPPTIGRIAIGRVIEKEGRRLPAKDDQFTITTLVQDKSGWVKHPLDEKLRKSANDKLRTIPIRLLFNDPDLNFRSEYSAFDRVTARPICVGNGTDCKRVTADGVTKDSCPSPDSCAFGQEKNCKPYGRLNVRLEDNDDLGTFIFRTTGFNSIRTLTARLHYFQAVSGDLLSCLPLALRLRGKSTAQSHRAPVFFVDLTLRDDMTMEQALGEAKTLHEKRMVAGFNQLALENAAREGLANGLFEDSSEETLNLLEEFYSNDVINYDDLKSVQPQQLNCTLTEKLNQQLLP